MSQCWPEGALRAYLDRELPPEDMQSAAAHLGECRECQSLYGEVKGRAARVSSLIDVLAEPQEVTYIPRMPQRAGARRRWPIAAAALAAGLVIAGLALPKRALPKRNGAVNVTPPPVTPALAPLGPVASISQPPIAAVPAQASVARHFRRQPPKARPIVDYYLALDDEPIETGVVMRVGLDDSGVQADVIFGPDGRERAIRLVSDRK
jgi:anti-sigma factor RsiW